MVSVIKEILSSRKKANGVTKSNKLLAKINIEFTWTSIIIPSLKLIDIINFVDITDSNYKCISIGIAVKCTFVFKHRKDYNI